MEEAVKAAAVGVNAIIAQGIEVGGHIIGQVFIFLGHERLYPYDFACTTARELFWMKQD